MILLSILFTFSVKANTVSLSNTIYNLCQMNSNVSEEEKIECGIYYVNCIVGKNGKWEDQDILRCVENFKEND